jgi:hypothetical protein
MYKLFYFVLLGSLASARRRRAPSFWRQKKPKTEALPSSLIQMKTIKKPLINAG